MKSSKFFVSTLIAAAAMTATAYAGTWETGEDGLPVIDGYAEKSSAAYQGQQTITENTVFTFTSDGNVGIADDAANGFNTNGYNLVLQTANGTEEMFINGTFLGNGNIYFASGRWQAQRTDTFANIGEIYVSGNTQLQLSNTQTISGDVFLGTTTFSTDGDLTNAALRVGVSNAAPVNATLAGMTTILSDTKIGYQDGATLNISNLTGSGNITTGRYSGSNNLNITGSTNFTGTIDVVSGITLNWTDTDGSFGGLSGNGAVGGGSTLNLALADGVTKTFSGTVGGADSAVNVNISGTGTQAFTGTSYLGTVTNSGRLTLGGTVVLSDVITNTGTVTLSEGIIFNLDNLNLVDGTNAIISGGTITAGITADNFEIGVLRGGSFDVVSSESALSVNFTQGTAGTITWKGTSADAVWSSATDNTAWTIDNSGTAEDTSFYYKDDVIFGSDAANKTVNLEAGSKLTVGTMSVTGGEYTLSTTANASSVEIEGTSLSVASGATLNLSSVLRGANVTNIALDFSDVSLSGTLRVRTNATDSWTKLTMATDDANLHLHDIGGDYNTTGLTISSLVANASGLISAQWGGKVVIDSLSGSANLKIARPAGEDIQFVISDMSDYSGTLTVGSENGYGLTVTVDSARLGEASVVVESGSTFAVNSPKTVNTLVDLSSVSGVGKLSVALNDVNGQGVNAGSFTGTLFVSGSSRLQLNQTILGEGATVEFADGADVVLNGSMEKFAQGMTFNGSTELYFNSSSSETVEFSGSISGGTLILQNSNNRTLNLSGAVELGGLSVSQNKTVNFTGERATIETVTLNSTGKIGGNATVTNLHLADTASFSGFSAGSEVVVTNAKATGGTSSISSTLDLSGALWVGGATLNLNSGANVTAAQLRMAEQGVSTLNIGSGATLTVTGRNNEHENGASLLLSHCSNGATLNLNGGKLLAEDAEMKMSWDGTGTFNATSGEARLKGLNFWGTGSGSGALKGHFILGSENSGSAKVYLGSSGISELTANGDSLSVILGNGTLGATDSWSTSYNGSFEAATIQLIGVNGGTVFDTEDPDDGVAHTVTINNAIAGTGTLVKIGTGELVLSGSKENYSGNVLVSKGTLTVSGDGALGSGNVTVESDGVLKLNGSGSINNLKNSGVVNLMGSTAQTWTLNVAESEKGSSGMLYGADDNRKGLHKLTKNGDGTLSLTTTEGGAASVYVALIDVQEGMLEMVSGKTGLGVPEFTDGETGATLGGTYADVSVASGATLKIVAGASAIQTGSLNLGADSTLVVDLKNVTATGEDITLNIVSATAINLNWTETAILTLSSEEPTIDGFVALENAEAFESYAKTWNMTETGISLTLTIPEPSAFGLLAGVGALALVVSRRRRNRR